jgi:hypothetical protein
MMVVGAGRRNLGISNSFTRSSHNTKIPMIEPIEYLFIQKVCIAHSGEVGFTQFVEFIEFLGLTRSTQQTQETE